MARDKNVKKQHVPSIGEEIYVPSEFYLSHGRDDIRGGCAVVTKITQEKHGDRVVHGICVEEFPEKTYYWENGLMQEQEKLRRQYGDRRARRDPDERSEFNSGSLVTKDDIRRWLGEGKERGATHVIVISDTFDYVYYPVYVMPGENPRLKAEEECGEFTSVKEVYSLSRDIESQLAERRALHWEGWRRFQKSPPFLTK